MIYLHDNGRSGANFLNSVIAPAHVEGIILGHETIFFSVQLFRQ